MAKEDAEHEPSIEEILTSIRQIISDDDDGEEEEKTENDVSFDEILEEQNAEPDPEPEEIEDDFSAEDEPEDVIELTDIVDPPAETDDEDESFSEPDVEEDVKVDLQDADIDDIFADATEAVEAVEEPEPEVEKPKPAARVETPEPPPVENLETLLTEKAADAAYKGFSELVKKTAVENGGITLEEIVRTELNPMLREWLDRHLPTIIERLVQDELERIAKRALEE